MKKISCFLVLLVFIFGCNQNEKKQIFKKNNELIYWIDSISKGKFLKIYTKPENDFQNLRAEFGNDIINHQIDLSKYNLLEVPFRSEIKWITKKSFALVNGCGTNCRYVIIFNVDNEEPIIQPIEYYPNMEYSDFETDNNNFYIAVNESYESQPSFVIIDTDSQMKDTVFLTRDWVRNNGAISNIIDEIKIENNIIEIIQHLKEGNKKKISKKINLN